MENTMNALTRADIEKLENKIDQLSNTTNNMGSKMQEVSSEMQSLKTELEQIRRQFIEMHNAAERRASENQAATELIRVRQELEQNFGNYKVIRDNMLGVLQATDLALVKQDTISRVSEELMLSTPEYWLAPCLVAVSAWIGNNRELAERAIREAVRRDEEKTALTMALICRRNNRQDTCYEWLSIYFAKQNSANFSGSAYAYIDAYQNGIFGPDTKHMCDDYVTKWMNELRGNSRMFEENQETLWKNYCEGFGTDIDGSFPELKQSVSEFPQINDYMKRINSVDRIADNFGQINHAYIDSEGLKAKIDKNLISLICGYDKNEERLRKEEKRCILIKEFHGDKEKAEQYISAEEKAKREKKLNLVEQMTSTIISKKDVSTSEKKTAVSFLSGYIRKGFQNYITEKKSAFPQQINLEIFGWKGATTDTGNYQQLLADYEAYMTANRDAELGKINEKKPKTFMVLGIILAVLTVVCIFAAWPLAILLGIGTIVMFVMRAKAIKQNEKNRQDITADYAQRIQLGQARIIEVMKEWSAVRNTVIEFEKKPLREIIA